MKEKEGMFPFLIGRIRTHDVLSEAITSANLFPFLIGRIRTITLATIGTPLGLVSIPHR